MKIGRPTIPVEKQCLPGLSVRLNDDDYFEVTEAMRVSGLTKSEWQRRALLYVARHGVDRKKAGKAND